MQTQSDGEEIVVQLGEEDIVGVNLKANCDIVMSMTLFGLPEGSTEKVSILARNEAGEECYVECNPSGVVKLSVPQLPNGEYLDLEGRVGESILAMECIEMDSIGGYFEAAMDFAAPAVMSGMIVDEFGNPVPGTTIAVVSEDGVRVPPLSTDGNGRFSISGLLPGNYTVFASGEGLGGLSTNAFVSEEGTEVAMTLKSAPVYRVSGSCTAAPMDAIAVLFDKECVAKANCALDGGLFEICADATGDYSLVVVDGDLIPLTEPVGVSIVDSDFSVGDLDLAEKRRISLALAPADGATGRSYALADGYGYAHSGTVSADGTIVEAVVPGAYTFSVALDDDEVWERDLVVADDSTFAFEIPVASAEAASAAIHGVMFAEKASDWVQIQISTTDTRNFSVKRMRAELSRYENALTTLVKPKPTYRCEHNLATYKEYTIARAWLAAEIGQAQGYIESIHQGNVLNGYSIAYDTAHLAANGFAWIVDLKETIADLYAQGYTIEDILKVYNSIMAAIDQFTIQIAQELQEFDSQLASLSDQIGIAKLSFDGKKLAYENALKNQRSAQARFNNYTRVHPDSTSTAEYQRLKKNLDAAKQEFDLARSAKTAAEEEVKSLKAKKTDVEFKIKDARQARFAELKENIKGKFKVGKYGKIAGKLLGALNILQTCKEFSDDVIRVYDNAQSLNDKREYFGKLHLPALQAAYERFLSAYRKAYHDNCRTGYYRPQFENTSIVSLSTPQSCDPNEMSGPLGAGARRVVEEGEWLTYTVYFENKETAETAAQEVWVGLALDPALDWSTFEVGEVVFGGQIDNGLSGRKRGTSEAKLEGTDYFVNTECAFDEATGKAEWYLRIVDKTTTDRWPKDLYAGILPPNDGTGRGEGHITYRVKVREDAAPGTVIRASASIVFDYNEAIETDPAWWNTVGQTSEVALSLGDGDEMSLGVVVGDAYGALPEPARTGWTFAGWWTGPGGTGTQVTPETIVSADTTALYAKWTRAVFDALWLDVTHGAVEIGTNGVTRGYGPEGDAVGGIAHRYYLTGTTSVHSVRYAGGSFTNTWTNLVISLEEKDAVAVALEGASVEVSLAGDSALSSGEDCAGVRVDAASALVLQGEGRLAAQGGKCGAGIGGGKLQESGRIEVRSGTVEARGGEYGAGIGGGLVAPAAREVVIAGGSVKARGSDGGEDIGGGFGREGTGAPVDAEGAEVHEVEVPLATDTLPAEVVVNVGGGKTYRYAGPGHEGDTSLWFWLPDGTYEFAADSDDYGAHVAGEGTSAVFTDPGNANFVAPPVGGVWNEDGTVRAGLNPAYRTSPFELWTATGLAGKGWNWTLLPASAYVWDPTNAVIRIPDDTNRMRMLRLRFLER